MDIAGEGGEEVDILHMGLIVQNRLIQMGNAPAQRNIELKKRRKLTCRRTGVGVPPGAEWNHYPAVLPEWEITVHHRADADTGEKLDINPVLTRHIGAKVGIAVLDTAPDIFHAISPDAVHQLVLPFVTSLRKCLSGGVDEYALDAG